MDVLPSIEVVTADPPEASVIWLHGLGADGNDFIPIVRELELTEAPEIRFVFPHAPMRPVTINSGLLMRAWYDIGGQDFSRGEDATGIQSSQREIENLIARERERGIPSSRIILAGFSQGGAIALQSALRHPQKLAGVIALSTYLPLARTIAAEAHPANAHTPIFMAHGLQDGVIPFAFAAASRDFLLKLGYRVKWREYPMLHSVCLEEIADISGFLRRVLT